MPSRTRARRDTDEGRARLAAEQRLRRSEALLAEAQALAHVGSWDWDLRTDELTCSDEHYRICGLEREEGSLLRERGMSAVHPDDVPRVRLALDESLRNGTAFELSMRLLRHVQWQLSSQRGNPPKRKSEPARIIRAP